MFGNEEATYSQSRKGDMTNTVTSRIDDDMEPSAIKNILLKFVRQIKNPENATRAVEALYFAYDE